MGGCFGGVREDHRTSKRTPKRHTHTNTRIHACRSFSFPSLLPESIHDFPQSLANQWALSPITLHNDPLFESKDICGGGEKRELQAAAFLPRIIRDSCSDMGVLGERVWSEWVRLSRGSNWTYPEEGTSKFLALKHGAMCTLSALWLYPGVPK